MPWVMLTWFAALFAAVVALVAMAADERAAAVGIAVTAMFWAGVAIWMRRQTA